MRITVQLIDARTDTHVWAQSYGREPSSALGNQRELAREVAGIIRSRIAPSDHTATPVIEQTNAAAYEAYVKGRYFMLQPSEASWLEEAGTSLNNRSRPTLISRWLTWGSRITSAPPTRLRRKRPCPGPKPARCGRWRSTRTSPPRTPRSPMCITSGIGTGKKPSVASPAPSSSIPMIPGAGDGARSI